MESVAGKCTCARTAVNFESWRIEEPPVEESFEASLVEWMGCLFHWDISHVGFEPARVDEESWVKICTTR
jgi:hypothetical protein